MRTSYFIRRQDVADRVVDFLLVPVLGNLDSPALELWRTGFGGGMGRPPKNLVQESVTTLRSRIAWLGVGHERNRRPWTTGEIAITAFGKTSRVVGHMAVDLVGSWWRCLHVLVKRKANEDGFFGELRCMFRILSCFNNFRVFKQLSINLTTLLWPFQRTLFIVYCLHSL